ncbi:MAG: AAA family ATPase [Deltaproteobacteria bacterium]|nr:AAA family ATPase [Deltaproteobacteria bacterium]
MSQNVFRVNKPYELRKAGPLDLIELVPVPRANSLYLPKIILEVYAYSIVYKELIHISGPTGTAKSSFLEAMALPENFLLICESLGFPHKKPIKLYTAEMACFESPGELYQRRSLKEGTTYDEPSIVIKSFRDGNKYKKTHHLVMWIKEIGRAHAPSVQGGLLDLMDKIIVRLPDGSTIDPSGFAWVCDSNYQAESDSIHTLVTLDDALKRRFSINITMDYLAAEQEEQVLHNLIKQWHLKQDLRMLVPKIVKLGQKIRHQRLEGNLQSATVPTIYGYEALLKMMNALPHLSLRDAVFYTILGNTSLEDSKTAMAVFNEIFGLQAEDEEEANLLRSMF